jgi:hypothetical protein
MTQKALKSLRALSAATARYTPRVERELSKTGKTNDAAVMSMAKYYVAIKKLANK